MADGDKKLSQLTEAQEISIGALIYAAEEDVQSETGFSSVRVTAANAGQSILNNFSYPLLLNTNNKTVFGAINELEEIKNNIIAGVIDQSTLSNFYTYVSNIFAAMDNFSMRAYDFRPGWSGNLFGGVRQPIWLYRRQSGAYMIFCPYNYTTGYYYSGEWHWSQSTMNVVTSPT